MLKPEFDTIETTYADLRPTDKIVAKDGTVWPIDYLSVTVGDDELEANFWLCDPATKVRLHLMARKASDPVTVSRIPTHADDVAKAEADFPGPVPSADAPDEVFDEWNRETPEQWEAADMDAVVETITEKLGATVEAEVTAEETDAARQATEEQPVELPAFADMTGLEQNTHLYLFHSVISYDLVSTARRIEMHTQAHADYAAGKLKARQIPHTHAEAKS